MLVFLLVITSLPGPPSVVLALNLTLLHMNDFHARFEETSVLSGNCHYDAGECYGGLARVHEATKDIRRRTLADDDDESGHVLFLNAGDLFQGTIWYTLFKTSVYPAFINGLNLTASVSYRKSCFYKWCS